MKIGTEPAKAQLENTTNTELGPSLNEPTIKQTEHLGIEFNTS